MKALSFITYLIYIVLWESLCIVGSGYVVFGLHRSGWYMVLGVWLSTAAYSPKKWGQLWSDKADSEQGKP